LEDMKRRHLFEELGKDERKILKSVLAWWGVRRWAGLF